MARPRAQLDRDARGPRLHRLPRVGGRPFPRRAPRSDRSHRPVRGWLAQRPGRDEPRGRDERRGISPPRARERGRAVLGFVTCLRDRPAYPPRMSTTLSSERRSRWLGAVLALGAACIVGCGSIEATVTSDRATPRPAAVVVSTPDPTPTHLPVFANTRAILPASGPPSHTPPMGKPLSDARVA